MAKNRTILVTGSSGFVGYHLVNRLLTKGISVIGVDNNNDYYDPKLKQERLKVLEKNKNFKFIKLNLQNKDLIKKLSKYNFTEIIHLGGQAGVRYSMENPFSYAYSNFVGSMNIFELAKVKKIKKVLYASSSSVYGLSKPPFSETSSIIDIPISVYAATKRSVEILAHTYFHLYGITMVGLRFFTVYGSYYRPDMAIFKFAKNILLGKEVTLYDSGKPKRGYTHVDDVVDGIIEALKIKPGNYYINLGGAEQISAKQLVIFLEKYLNKKAIIKNVPMQPGDVFETRSDQKVAQKLLKFKPKVKFEEGIKDFCDWFLQNQKWLLKLKPGKQ